MTEETRISCSIKLLSFNSSLKEQVMGIAKGLATGCVSKVEHSEKRLKKPRKQTSPAFSLGRGPDNSYSDEKSESEC